MPADISTVRDGIAYGLDIADSDPVKTLWSYLHANRTRLPALDVRTLPEQWRSTPSTHDAQLQCFTQLLIIASSLPDSCSVILDCLYCLAQQSQTWEILIDKIDRILDQVEPPERARLDSQRRWAVCTALPLVFFDSHAATCWLNTSHNGLWSEHIARHISRLADLMRRRSAFELAVQLYTIAATFAGGLQKASICCHCANLLHLLGRHSAGVAYASAAIDLDPTYGTAWALLGANISASDPAIAEGHLLHALELDPTDSFARGALGRVLIYQARYREALKHLEMAFELDPANAIHCSSIVTCLDSQGDGRPDEAVNDIFMRFITAYLARSEVQQEQHTPTTDEHRISQDLRLLTMFFTDTRLLAQIDSILRKYSSTDKGPGTGLHPLDDLLLQVETLLLPLHRCDPSRALTYGATLITILVSQYERTSETGNSEFRTRLLLRASAILTHLNGIAEATGSSETKGILKELQLRLAHPRQEEYAAAILDTARAWFNENALDQSRTTGRDLRHRLCLYTWAHVQAFYADKNSQEERRFHIEQIHNCVELLKGQFLLFDCLPGSRHGDCVAESDVARTVGHFVIGIEALQSSLGDDASGSVTAVNMYYLDDPLKIVPHLLIIIVYTRHDVQLRILDHTASDAMTAFRTITSRIAAVSAVVGRREAEVMSVFAHTLKNDRFQAVLPDAPPPEPARLWEVLAAWFEDAFERAGQILGCALRMTSLSDCTMWLSPAAEMYRLPLGLLRFENQYLCDIVKHLYIVPVFSSRPTGATQCGRRAQVVYGQARWAACRREATIADSGWEASSFPASPATRCEAESAPEFPFEGDGRSTERYEAALECMRRSDVVHCVSHHHLGEWYGHDGQELASLGSFLRYLYRLNYQLGTNLFVLECCCGRQPLTQSRTAVMGAWCLLLTAGVAQIVASPFQVWPTRSIDGDLAGMEEYFNCFYSELDVSDVSSVSRGLRKARQALQAGSRGSDDPYWRMPIAWGGFELITTLPIVRTQSPEIE